MKKIGYSGVLSICYCIGVVLVLIFLYGCSGTTHTISTEQVPMQLVGSDTIVEEWKLVENPNTGIMEMRLVRRVRTTVSTSSSSSIENKEHAENKGLHYPSNNDTGRTILVISSFVVAVATLYIVVSK